MIFRGIKGWRFNIILITQNYIYNTPKRGLSILFIFIYSHKRTYSQTHGISKLARDVKNVTVDSLPKASNVISTQENVSVNQPLLDDDAIGASWVTMVTRLKAAKVRYIFFYIIFKSWFN